MEGIATKSESCVTILVRNPDLITNNSGIMPESNSLQKQQSTKISDMRNTSIHIYSSIEGFSIL